jgi:hypothetical protein
MRIHTTHTRDAALRELNRITRWLIAGSVVLTGVLSDVAASAFSGRSTKHGTNIKSAAAHAHEAHKRSTGTSTSALKPPAQAPTTSAEQPSAPEPAPEPAPAHEATPEPAPAHEATPEPAPEESGPVVSGGS